MTSARRRVAVAGTLATFVIVSCGQSNSAPDSSRTGSAVRPGEIPPKGLAGEAGSPALAALAESYVRIALKLAQHDPELVDGWMGPAAWRPGPREPVAPILAEVEALQRELGGRAAGPGEANRMAYLAAQTSALHLAATRLLGRTAPFNEEVRAAFGISPRPIDRQALDDSRAALGRELSGSGDLANRYAAFKRNLAIKPARVERVLRAALDVCRTATLGQITLPADEAVDLALVTGSPWDGYARYEGNHRTRVEINREGALDVSRALRLACHEGYPGHHVQHIWIDDELVRKRQWQEFELAPAFGRHLLVIEGAAEAAADVLFPDDKRVAVYRDALLPAAGLPPSEAARIVRVESLVASLEPVIVDVVAAYLDNSLTQAGALDRLRNEALVVNGEALLAFAERRRTRVVVYPEGRLLVRPSIARGGLPELRRIFVDQPFAVQ